MAFTSRWDTLRERTKDQKLKGEICDELPPAALIQIVDVGGALIC